MRRRFCVRLLPLETTLCAGYLFGYHVPMKHHVRGLAVLASLLAVFGVAAWFLLGRTCDTERFSGTFVVTAFHTETDAVRARSQELDRCRVGQARYELRTYEDTSFVLFASGVGPRRAHATVTRTLGHFPVTALIMSGTAGGVDRALVVGDVVVPAAWLDLASTDTFTVDTRLLAIAGGLGTVQQVSLGATAEAFVKDISELPAGVSIVDMETAAVARLSGEAGVPFVALRAVSDAADGTENDEGFALAADAAADATLRFLVLLGSVATAASVDST